jgi:hypothetical protein
MPFDTTDSEKRFLAWSGMDVGVLEYWVLQNIAPFLHHSRALASNGEVQHAAFQSARTEIDSGRM